MDRKEFIIQAGLLTVFSQLAAISSSSATIPSSKAIEKDIDISNLPSIPDTLKKDFLDLLHWMQEHGWYPLIRNISKIAMEGITDPKDGRLMQEFTPNQQILGGGADFSGQRLIEPGKPQMSLLYHVLAHPLIKLNDQQNASAYPSLQQLDTLENFIYSLQPIEPSALDSGKFVLAVFSYEYRPAQKTPHRCHADMVFSRTAFARIGNQPAAPYDRINRCFTNLPEQGSEKEIAAFPARYGLFLAEVVEYAGNRINVMPYGAIIRSDRKDQYEFLCPVRKVFKGDLYLGANDIYFTESHVNEKLRRLTDPVNELLLPDNFFRRDQAPFIRHSNSSTQAGAIAANKGYDRSMVRLEEAGSSVLLIPVEAPLVRRAVQQVNGREERVRVNIHKRTRQNLLKSTNRRYTSYKLLRKSEQNKDAVNAIQIGLFYRHRIVTDYHAPRNAPMFFNIRERISKDGTVIHLHPGLTNLLQETNRSYWAGLFEDSICDGCVGALIINGQTANENDYPADLVDKILKLKRLPAFSVVTAPDFFPNVDSNDLQGLENLFLVGGIEDMGGARLRANPDIQAPYTDNLAFPVNGGSRDPEERVAESIIRVLSHKESGPNSVSTELLNYQRDQLIRTNFLPDSATRIFFPGWDVSYSGKSEQGNILNIRFFTSYGLGSPFVEDSKLCAAVNGMWAAASPDAARTFRNSLTTVPGLKPTLPPTAIPLLDIELGLHPESPACVNYHQDPSTGWDGEQGPFFVQEDKGLLTVNFTDINRSDYVQNALNDLFDMSKMRRLTTKEVRFRMYCLQRCHQIKGLDLSRKYWLVGAEEVKNWSAGAQGYSIPPDLYGQNNRWATTSRLTNSGAGYLFVFAKTRDKPQDITGTSRQKQRCEKLVVCQVSNDEFAACILTEHDNWKPEWT